MSVSRTASTVACTTTLSLFATIFALASVNASQLRWDGSFCAKPECSQTMLAASQIRPLKPL